MELENLEARDGSVVGMNKQVPSQKKGWVFLNQTNRGLLLGSRNLSLVVLSITMFWIRGSGVLRFDHIVEQS